MPLMTLSFSTTFMLLLCFVWWKRARAFILVNATLQTLNIAIGNQHPERAFGSAGLQMKATTATIPLLKWDS
jgi:hypothetical protein